MGQKKLPNAPQGNGSKEGKQAVKITSEKGERIYHAF
jgi:hypothetical protein